jgi:hypothetical protein
MRYGNLVTITSGAICVAEKDNALTRPEVFERKAPLAPIQRAAAARADQLPFVRRRLRFDAHDFVFGPAGGTRKRGCLAHGVAQTS